MNRYPRSIRYALSNYSNNPKKRRNTSESQRMDYQKNYFSNSFNQKENPNSSNDLINEYQQLLDNNNKQKDGVEE